MISSFDIAKLHSLLKDFYQLTKIRITVFDDSFRELTSYPDEIADFCKLIRQTPGCAMKCHLCDRHACDIASRRTSFLYLSLSCRAYREYHPDPYGKHCDRLSSVRTCFFVYKL